MVCGFMEKISRLYRVFCLNITVIVIFFSILSPKLLCEDTNIIINTNSPIKLGAIVSLTGPAAKNGRNWLEGAELAVSDLQNRGTNVDLIIEDDATIPNKVATAFSKLANVDKVAGIIGGTWDFLAEAAYPLAKHYQTYFITPTNPIEAMSSDAQKNPWIFTNSPSLKAEELAISKFLKSRKIKDIGLVYINVPYGIIHADLLSKIAFDLNIKVSSNISINFSGYNDEIKLAALKLKNSKPELIFIVLNYEGVDMLLKEFQKINYNPIVLTTHTLGEALEFAKTKKRYSKAFAIYPKFSSESFGKTFLKKFNHPAFDYSAAAYDAIMFLVQLIKAKEESNNINISYEGISGLHRYPSPGPSIADTKAVVLSANEICDEMHLGAEVCSN